MTKLIIARHGNTFGPNDAPTRVGARTDLSLVESGRMQAQKIGGYLKASSLIPDVVYCSTLQRTQETAEIAIKATGITNPIFPLEIFDEIDYGPDENKTEGEVVSRIGQDAIDAWNNDATVPNGWIVDPDRIIHNWNNFATQIRQHDDDETILVVTSNGIARFAPHITGDFAGFKAKHSLKLSTGALGIIEFSNETWSVLSWNIKP